MPHCCDSNCITRSMFLPSTYLRKTLSPMATLNQSGRESVRIPDVQGRHHAKLDRRRFREHTPKATHWLLLELTRRHSEDGSIQEKNMGSQGARGVGSIRYRRHRWRGRAGRNEGSGVQTPNATCSVSESQMGAVVRIVSRIH